MIGILEILSPDPTIFVLPESREADIQRCRNVDLAKFTMGTFGSDPRGTFPDSNFDNVDNLIVIILCDWNPFAVPPRDNVLVMLLISPALLCLFLVGYFMQKKILLPWTVLAGILIAVRVRAFHS